jgi:hypothetical protein
MPRRRRRLCRRLCRRRRRPAGQPRPRQPLWRQVDAPRDRVPLQPHDQRVKEQVDEDDVQKDAEPRKRLVPDEVRRRRGGRVEQPRRRLHRPAELVVAREPLVGLPQGIHWDDRVAGGAGGRCVGEVAHGGRGGGPGLLRADELLLQGGELAGVVVGVGGVIER